MHPLVVREVVARCRQQLEDCVVQMADDARDRRAKVDAVGRLLEWALDYEQTPEEAREELEAAGVDVDAFLERVRKDRTEALGASKSLCPGCRKPFTSPDHDARCSSCAESGWPDEPPKPVAGREASATVERRHREDATVTLQETGELVTRWVLTGVRKGVFNDDLERVAQALADAEAYGRASALEKP